MSQRVTGRYFYKGMDGKTLYWKERLEPGRKSPKEFRFYHGDKALGRGSDPILYNLPLVAASRAVIFTEGEKQADIVTRWGLVGTTFDSGSNSKFPAAMVGYLKGKRVAILRDNDAPGLVYAEMIANMLHGVAEVVKIVLLPGLPPKGDLCDWTGDKELMLEEIRKAADFVYVAPPTKPQRKAPPVPTDGDVTGDMVAAAKAVPVDTLLEFQGGYSFCLWHKEDNPSLHHHAASNRVKCFSCGKSADGVDILIQRDGVGFRDAVKYLCGK